jgi:hypothetical protein
MFGRFGILELTAVFLVLAAPMRPLAIMGAMGTFLGVG